MTDETMKKLKEHDEQLEVIARTVLANKERLDRVEQNMATKEDANKIMNTLDELVGLHRKTDQEQTFMSAHLKRVEEQTEKNIADIQEIKPLVGLGATS